MEYNSKGYGDTVEKPKKKNYKIPIIIVAVVAVIAAALIWYAMSVAKTVTIEGDSPTTANLSGYVDEIADRFYVEAESLTLYEDSTAEVENGAISSLDLRAAMVYGSVTEYWQIAETDGGIKMTYKGELDDGETTFYTLPQLCAYLAGIDEVMNGALSSPVYSVKFCAEECGAAQSGGYLWNGGSFEILSADIAGTCYLITVTAADGAQYAFYAV